MHLRIPTRIGEAHDRGDGVALQVRRPAHAARLWCTVKRARADDALGVHGTETGMRPGKRSHGLDELRNHGSWCGSSGHGGPPSWLKNFMWCAEHDHDGRWSCIDCHDDRAPRVRVGLSSPHVDTLADAWSFPLCRGRTSLFWY